MSTKVSNTKNNPEKVPNTSKRNTEPIPLSTYVKILGPIAVIVAALIAFKGQVFTTSRPIEATQTAEAHATAEQQYALERARSTGAVNTSEALIANSQETARTIIDDAGTRAAATQIGYAARATEIQSTMTAINLPATPSGTVEEEKSSIDDFLLSVFPYSGMADPEVGFSGATFSIDRTTDLRNHYRLEYFFSEEGIGYAGLAFKFKEPVDFLNYKTLEIILEYSDQKILGDLILHDINTAEERVPVGPNATHSPDILINSSGLTQTIQIPVTYFKAIDLNVIREITLHFDNSKQNGNFTITLREMTLK